MATIGEFRILKKKTNIYSDEISLLPKKYNIEDLPFDNVNGFDGGKEYDNVYLTNTSILAYQMDATFQNDCKNIFNKQLI